MIAVMVSQRGRLVNCFYFLARDWESGEKNATRKKGRPVPLFKMKDAHVQRQTQPPGCWAAVYLGGGEGVLWQRGLN